MPLARSAACCCALLLTLAAPLSAFAQSAELKQLQTLAQSGDVDRAATEVDAYIKAHPKDPRGRFLKGVVLGRQNRIDEAIAVYRGLTQDYPELPEPYNNLGAALAAKGEYEAARDALQAAIRAQPSYAVAHENLGDIYLSLAAASYAKAVSLDRSAADARRKLKVVNELVSPAEPPATPK